LYTGTTIPDRCDHQIGGAIVDYQLVIRPSGLTPPVGVGLGKLLPGQDVTMMA
jgi:hypothetical protein